MNTKIVYVLVSDSSDFYYEQTLISLYSLKYWNPAAFVCLVVDDETNQTFGIESRKELLNYVSEKKVIRMNNSESKVQRSRLLKTGLRSFIDGDYLYIDSDTVITDSLSEIDTFPMNVGCVLDSHRMFDKKVFCDAVFRASVLGYDVASATKYWNGGVMYVKDNNQTREFLGRWNSLCQEFQKVGMNYDQPPLLICDIQTPIIEELPGEYNCQIRNGGLAYLGYSKILHPYNAFGNDNFYLFMDLQYLMKIKAQRRLNDDDKRLIQRGRAMFMTESEIAYGEMLLFYKSAMSHLFRKKKSLFNILNICARLFLKF